MDDQPKSLGYPGVLRNRIALLQLPHMAPLTELVNQLRAETGFGERIPYFDPLDGGVEARCLFLLEAPGPKAVKTGFISRNNPDESAKNWFLANAAAGIPRGQTLTWNIVPWYIGSGRRIRPANRADVGAGLSYLDRLLQLLPRLEIAVLVGGKAVAVEPLLRSRYPRLSVRTCPHPSPVFVNRGPANRQRLHQALREVADFLNGVRLKKQ